jgi:hypothetical protein
MTGRCCRPRPDDLAGNEEAACEGSSGADWLAIGARIGLPPMSSTPTPIRVNRASVLTLWATVVAERLGYPPETP